METKLARPSLEERLSDPHTSNLLHRILDHAESLERLLSAGDELSNLLAIAVDTFDAISLTAAQKGIDIEQRATSLANLFIQLTETSNMQTLTQLVARLPKLAQGATLLDELPNLVAIAMDVFDEWAQKTKDDGINLESSLRQSLYAALYLGGQIRKEELDRIGFLLKSDLMSENSVATVGMAGSALSSCRSGRCEHPVPKRVGLFGLLGALRDHNTQRTLSFALQFAKCFGGVLEQHPESDLCSPDSSKTD